MQAIPTTSSHISYRHSGKFVLSGKSLDSLCFGRKCRLERGHGWEVLLERTPIQPIVIIKVMNACLYGGIQNRAHVESCEFFFGGESVYLPDSPCSGPEGIVI
mmetsp:Transcript_10710/g.40098  ORF Transcript_10710/g.40098 Transcript_10710/m.40098 type:complete len:103 (-) Transcript_10710:1084-1392(-)